MYTYVHGRHQRVNIKGNAGDGKSFYGTALNGGNRACNRA